MSNLTNATLNRTLACSIPQMSVAVGYDISQKSVVVGCAQLLNGGYNMQYRSSHKKPEIPAYRVV